MKKRSFNEIKADAKMLGIKIPGKKAVKLEEEIAEAKAQMEANPNAPVEGNIDEAALEEKTKVEAEALAREKELEQRRADDLAEKSLKESKELAEKRSNRSKFNAVVIYKGKMNVRTYSLEVHGEDFDKKAEEFLVGRNGYRMEKILVKDEILCPNCGLYFAPRS